MGPDQELHIEKHTQHHRNSNQKWPSLGQAYPGKNRAHSHQGCQTHASDRPEMSIPLNGAGKERAVLVIEIDEQTPHCMGQEILVPEFPQDSNMRVGI